jgi:carnitine O-acetyltransferase
MLVDRLMYTITSRKEMPNKEFCSEIAKAADDLFELFMVDEARM